MEKSRAKAKALGDLQYFTGKPCKHGHIAARITSNGTCLVCARAYQLLHRARNPDSVAKTQRQYRKAHKPQTSAYKKAYRISNLERCRRLDRESAARRKSNAEYRQKLSIYQREWSKAFRRTSKGRCVTAIRTMLRRSMLGQEVKELAYTPEQLKAHLEALFEPWMNWENYGLWQVDHKTPLDFFLGRGVKDPKVIHALDNLRPLCAKENMRNGAIYRHQKHRGKNPTPV